MGKSTQIIYELMNNEKEECCSPKIKIAKNSLLKYIVQKAKEKAVDDNNYIKYKS